MNVQRDTVITVSREIKTSLEDFLRAGETWNDGLLRMQTEAGKYQRFVTLIGEM